MNRNQHYNHLFDVDVKLAECSAVTCMTSQPLFKASVKRSMVGIGLLQGTEVASAHGFSQY